MKILVLLCLILATFRSTCYAHTSEIKEVFVKANKAEIFCKVIGQGDPILVLHGGPGLTQDYLFPQMAKLGENHLVIFYDQRACGRSTGDITPNSIQIDVFLDDIESIRKAFGFKKMTLLGHSWGGFLAMNYAIRHPQSVDKLILMNTMTASSDEFSLFLKEASRRTAPSQEEIKAIMNSQAFIDGDPTTVERYYRIFYRTYCCNAEKVNLLNLRMSPKAAVDGTKVFEVFRQNVLMKSFDLYDQLKKLKTSTLIIHGDADPIPQIASQKIHDSIPNSRYVLLKNCGHFPYVEDPDVLFKHLGAFLEQDVESGVRDLICPAKRAAASR
jgi:proline iminopeptidase